MRMLWLLRPMLAVLAGVVALAGAVQGVAAADPVLLAAGDIASCSSTGDEATAALLDTMAGSVITLGDNVYDSGTAGEFASCYDPTWGRQVARTRPAAGNHDYATANAAGYFGYFGAAAGDPAKGYYSYDLGAWHIVVINSNCTNIGGCQQGSQQETWLRADLAANPAECVLAYWHHPLFSSGLHGANSVMRPIWQALYDYGADLVLNGHDHNYERFAPQTPDGGADAAAGIREFVVGTGGRSSYQVAPSGTNSEARNGDTFGVLSLTLHPSGYDWQFVPQAGKTFTDSGAGSCHAAPQASVGGTARAPDAPPLPAADAHGGSDRRGAIALGASAVAGLCALAATGWVVRRKRRV